MYRLSKELAVELLKKSKNPQVITMGENAFKFSNEKSIGIIDPICSLGTDSLYILESPVPILYPELPYTKTIDGYFLYRRNELVVPMDSWDIPRNLVDKSCTDPEEQIDVADCSVIIATDIDKLVKTPIKTMEQLFKLEPFLMDCVNL